MPLGIITDDELENELSNNGAVIKDMPFRGRPEGTKNVPEEIQKIISEEAIEGSKSKELQAIFGVSASSVSAYKNGSTSTATYNEGNKELSEHANGVKDRISKRAEGRLNMALKAMTPNKFQKARLRDLAGVAREMSAVIKNMEPEKSNDNRPLAQFIIHVPPMREEKEYQVIEVEN